MEIGVELRALGVNLLQAVLLEDSCELVVYELHSCHHLGRVLILREVGECALEVIKYRQN